MWQGKEAQQAKGVWLGRRGGRTWPAESDSKSSLPEPSMTLPSASELRGSESATGEPYGRSASYLVGGGVAWRGVVG